MKRTVSALLLIAILVFTAAFAVSCGSKLKGTWVCSVEGEEIYKLEFTSDELTIYEAGEKDGTYKYTDKDGKITITKDGKEESMKYTLDGDKLTVTLDGMDITFTKQ